MFANGFPPTQRAISSANSIPSLMACLARSLTLPLHARIQTRHAESPVDILSRDLHLPNSLRRRGLGNLKNRGGGGHTRALVEFHISIGQQLRVAAKERENRRQIVHPFYSCGFCRFIELHDRNAANARRCRPANISARIQDAVISVVKQYQLKHSAAVHASDVGIVLRVKPVDWVRAVREREVTLKAQFPQDVSRTLAIVVINFYHPKLVPNRNDQGFVVR